MKRKSGIFFPEKLYQGGLLTLYPTYLEECINYALQNDIKGIRIESYFHDLTDDKQLRFFHQLKEITNLEVDLSNYEADNLDFLFPLGNLKSLTIGINTKTVKNVEGLYSLKHLTELGLLTTGPRVDLSQISSLEEVSFHWDKNRVVGIADLPKLQKLSIDSFNPKGKSFQDLPANDNLVRLKLFRGNQRTFSQFPLYPKLESLETDCYGKLEELKGVEKLGASLKRLRMEHSRKITDHQVLQHLPQLETLMLWNCGTMEDLSFLKQLRKLKIFNFGKSNVQDGNLSSALSHPALESIWFNNKKHYSHTEAELQEYLERKFGTAKDK
ncbi:MAG: hypothetical protein HRU41_40085 [Saprospiraceae bacterium]|nr:hypothetical protein [Saprospiraceae bacterium]